MCKRFRLAHPQPADVVLESSAGPLLDIQSSPAVKEFYGVELVTISE